MIRKPHDRPDQLRVRMLLPLCLLVFSFGEARSADAARLPGTRVLTDGRLVVEVMDPASPDRYNRGTRFSPLANVLRARLDGHEFLHAPDTHDPLLDNGGLASEFDLLSDEPPPGFDEAKIGDGYVKIGVGVLKKTRARYDFWPVSPVIEEAKTTATWGTDRASFQQVCDGVNGYAYRLAAEVRVAEAGVTIECRLTNTGEKVFSTMQYAHNYLAFDGAEATSDYRIEFPYEPAPVYQPDSARALRQRGNTLVFDEALKKTLNAKLPWPAGYDGPNQLSIYNVNTGMRLTMTTSIAGPFVFLHATSGYVCPEQFVRVRIEPGETIFWERVYRFETGVSFAKDDSKTGAIGQ